MDDFITGTVISNIPTPQTTTTWATTTTSTEPYTVRIGDDGYWRPIVSTTTSRAIDGSARWIQLCTQLLELFKDHFERGDFDISEDEFWKIWNDG